MESREVDERARVERSFMLWFSNFKQLTRITVLA